MPLDFNSYDTENFYDELIKAPGVPRPGAKILVERIEALQDGDILRRQKADSCLGRGEADAGHDVSPAC